MLLLFRFALVYCCFDVFTLDLNSAALWWVFNSVVCCYCVVAYFVLFLVWFGFLWVALLVVVACGLRS